MVCCGWISHLHQWRGSAMPYCFKRSVKLWGNKMQTTVRGLRSKWEKVIFFSNSDYNEKIQVPHRLPYSRIQIYFKNTIERFFYANELNLLENVFIQTQIKWTPTNPPEIVLLKPTKCIEYERSTKSLFPWTNLIFRWTEAMGLVVVCRFRIETPKQTRIKVFTVCVSTIVIGVNLPT